ncbi:uncharacterized protein CCR75_001922 [Bremia lactucae]|uniref:Protein SERAC1 n=1 Tax=Bremia lactucae TaxID=4779 RepID=A0A976IGT0_BRELC|nr:hypothetical protein CCR75_001922 [Bremia lactucae]
MIDWILSRGQALVAVSSFSRRLASCNKSKCHHLFVRKNFSVPSALSVTFGVGASVLLLATSSVETRRLRQVAHSGALILQYTGIVTAWKDALDLAMQFTKILSHGGINRMQDELVRLLLTFILHVQDDEQGQRKLLCLLNNGVMPLLVQYAAFDNPVEPIRLQQLVGSMTKLLKFSAQNREVNLRLSVTALGQALAQIMKQQDDLVSHIDLAQFGNAFMKFEQMVHGAAIFRLNETECFDLTKSSVSTSCAAFVNMCSPEMPNSLKKIGLLGLEELARAADRDKLGAFCAQDLKALMGPEFAKHILAFPRNHDDLDLQLRASFVLDRLLHVARRNPAAVARDTYELWMKQICYWTETKEPVIKCNSKKVWRQRIFGQCSQNVTDEASVLQQRLLLKLQLTSLRCMRTLTTSPQSRRYFCESFITRKCLIRLSHQIHERSLYELNFVDEDTARSLVNMQRHISWTFRNLCKGFQSGAMALSCLFNATGAASRLQSRRNLPMSRFFRGINDLTDLPIMGAEEYEESTEFGWVDILTAWTASTDHQLRENAIASLVFLAEQDSQPFSTYTVSEENEVRTKQEHILQAWLTNMLQQIRLLSGGELLAVKQMEEIALVSRELTPGNERILFNPAVVDAGTSALAVLAEHHHTELVEQGIAPLVALLSATRVATPALHTQCARVFANLIATFCFHVNLKSSAPFLDQQKGIILNDHVNIAELFQQTATEKQFFDKVRRWHNCEDPMQRSSYFRVVQNLCAYEEAITTGRLLQDVYCEGVHPIMPKSTVEFLEQSRNSKAFNAEVDVVFVHGLRGHPFGTWRTNMNSAVQENNDIWPDVLLAKDLQRNNVSARLITLGYEADMVSWSSPWPSLTLHERARVMLSALHAANIGRNPSNPSDPGRPIIFIAHSMGGLLTKEMLLLDSNQHEHSGLADCTTGVVFLAVPHFGSDLANGVQYEAIRKLVQTHPALKDLGADPNGRLKVLNDNFKQLGIDCFSAGEEYASPVALGISAIVVKPDSADPGVGRFYVVPTSDHMTICKAKSRDEPLYQDILQYVIQRVRA